jgi:small GTP-binding protein
MQLDTCVIIIVGDQMSGKSTLMHRMIHDKFTLEYIPTIGVDFASTVVNLVDTGNLKLKIWDCAGQERFFPITRVYFTNANVAMITFDMRELFSSNSIHMWIQRVHMHSKVGRCAHIMLVGTNSDSKKSVLTKNVATQFAHQNNLTLIQVSSKSGKNVKEAFYAAARMFTNCTVDENTITLTKDNTPQHSCCC